LFVCSQLVGDELLRGISGGQRKRLSIGVETISMPELIFLDEPTSGLDSEMALEVLSAVRKMTNQNRTVMTTIHQPSPEVFEMFDKVMLLSAGKVWSRSSVVSILIFFFFVCKID
jgi:ABC-type multidrug transport system ATPase subunit